eukprot:SAG31_NODE_2742_length_5154_cov_4.341048_2_plen_716_part_00
MGNACGSKPEADGGRNRDPPAGTSNQSREGVPTGNVDVLGPPMVGGEPMQNRPKDAADGQHTPTADPEEPLEFTNRTVPRPDVKIRTDIWSGPQGSPGPSKPADVSVDEETEVIGFSPSSSPANSPKQLPPAASKTAGSECDAMASTSKMPNLKSSAGPLAKTRLAPTLMSSPTQSASAAPPQRTATVVQDFVAEQPGDLTLKVGQVVVITKARENKQWWKGYLQHEPALRGAFPKVFVTENQPSHVSASAAALAPDPVVTAKTASAETKRATSLGTTKSVSAPIVSTTAATAEAHSGAAAVEKSVVVDPLQTLLAAPASITVAAAAIDNSSRPSVVASVEVGGDPAQNTSTATTVALPLSVKTAEASPFSDNDWDDDDDDDDDDADEKFDDQTSPKQEAPNVKQNSTKFAISPVAAPPAIDLGDIYGSPVQKKPIQAAPAAAVAVTATVAPTSAVAAVAAVATVVAVPGDLPAQAVSRPKSFQLDEPTPIDLGDIYASSSIAEAHPTEAVLPTSGAEVDDTAVINLGDIYASSKAAKNDLVALDTNASASGIQAEVSPAGDSTSFAGPDPSGTICTWQYNEADQWYYSDSTAWLYNKETQVYFDKMSGICCQYDSVAGQVVRGSMQNDPHTGWVHFFPDTDGSSACSQQYQQQHHTSNNIVATLQDLTNVGGASGGIGQRTADQLQGRPTTSGRKRLDAALVIGSTAASTSYRW